MKKLVLSIIALSSISILQAQKVKFGAKASLNLSKFILRDPNEQNLTEPKFLTGFNVGCFAEISITDKFAFQPELLYATQGSKLETKEFDNINGSYYLGDRLIEDYEGTFKTSYINIPLLAKYYATKKLFFVAGPQIGVLLNAKRTIIGFKKYFHLSGDGITTFIYDGQEEDVKDLFTSFAVGLGIGTGYFFTENLFAEARYNIDLSKNQIQRDRKVNEHINVSPYSQLTVSRSTSIQVAVGYRF
jgi:hypothetical protein